MKILKLTEQNELKVKNIKGFLKRKVVVSGTSAKVNCPKEYLNCDAILIILENGIKKRDKRVKGSSASTSNRDNKSKKRK
jgi:putative transposon-encoded protein